MPVIRVEVRPKDLTEWWPYPRHREVYYTGPGIPGAGPPPPWNPSDAPGYLGSPHSITAARAAGQMWRNAAKTELATLDGDPVRVMVCDGVEYAAPSSAARPLLWDKGGGKWSLLFDGVDDQLIADVSRTWVDLGHAVWAGVQIDTFTTYQVVAITGQYTGGWRLCTRLATPPWGTYQIAGEVPADSVLADSTNYVLAMNGGEFVKDGAADGSYPSSQGNAFGVGTIYIGCDSDLRFLSGLLDGVAIYTQPQAAPDAALIDSYFAAL